MIPVNAVTGGHSSRGPGPNSSSDPGPAAVRRAWAASVPLSNHVILTEPAAGPGPPRHPAPPVPGPAAEARFPGPGSVTSLGSGGPSDSVTQSGSPGPADPGAGHWQHQPGW